MITRAVVTIGFIACTIASAARAHADVSPEAAAKATALFKEGQAIIDAGPKERSQIDEACDKFVASLDLDPQIGTRLNLADCRERQGRLVDAYTMFQVAADEAARTLKQGREEFARKRMAALAAKLGFIRVQLAEPNVAGLSIKLGSRELPRAEWSRAQPVEPGTIVVEISAPDRKPLRFDRAVVAGGNVSLDIPVLEQASPPPASSPSPVVVGPVADTPVAAHRSRTPYIIGGAGVVLLVASGAIGLHAKSIYDDAVRTDDMNRVIDARHEADIATGVAIAGGVAIAAAAVLFVRTRGGDQSRVVVSPTPIGDTTGITLTRAF